MADVVVHGPVSWNHVVHVDELPDPSPHLQFATAHYDVLGGTSAGKAAHLRELGVHTVPAAPVATIVDFNGAGDGFMAGFMAAHLRGLDVPAALQAGSAQAARALSTIQLSPQLDPSSAAPGRTDHGR